MKNDKDMHLDCLLFQKCIHSYIDDELQETEKKDFLSHSIQCPSCSSELKDAERVKKVLTNIPRVTVSPAFDFTMRARIRAEHAMLRKPVYRLKLFLRENIAASIALPAAAAILFFSLINHHGYFSQPQMPAHTIINVQNTSEDPVGISMDYTLDLLESSDFERGIFLNVRPEEQLPTNGNIRLVNF